MTQLCDTWEANKSIFEEKPTMIKTRMDRKLDGKTDINTGSQTGDAKMQQSCMDGRLDGKTDNGLCSISSVHMEVTCKPAGWIGHNLGGMLLSRAANKGYRY
ncbi:uncharacterized protein LOC124287182 isoform X4 [Haliotis rubra]|uniref:uncharacterized protein LOC124287182 isoform X4 n=1 Tax=Haliotis rubra TaxID=36100 RepID=UPI001EE53FEA|nr:uncharacterized protein LOC124287182 isoform X4 [Haliotis rubra]